MSEAGKAGSREGAADQGSNRSPRADERSAPRSLWPSCAGRGRASEEEPASERRASGRREGAGAESVPSECRGGREGAGGQQARGAAEPWVLASLLWPPARRPCKV